MSNEISRVYQFLAERPDWKTEMDTNNDGTILKSEFRDFLAAEFDWESLEGWNGETSKQTDLINEFWKNIDTTQTGNITGTNFKNKNALDSKEITNMNLKIEMYEILNDYTSTLSAPSVVSDSSRWKQSVNQSLANLTETFIKNGGVKEDLLAYLESVSEGVQNKTTADCVADEYLNTELKDFMKEYNYSYLEDKTLQGIISNYIQNIPEGSTAEDIKSTVQLNVDAYLATAGVKEDNAFDLSAYGYSVNDATALNDLQKTYLTKTLQTAFENVQNETGYESNKELYDNAVNEFINNILSGAKFNDFETIKGYTYENFTNSEQYKEVTDVVAAKELLKGDDLYNRVASEINQSLADLIKNDGRYLDVMDDIEAELITQVTSGEFSVDGNLDTNAMLDWAVKQIQSRIMEFYENGLGDLSLSELNDLYDMLYVAANNEPDDDKSEQAHKDAANKYLDAISSKNDLFKNAVESVFNGKSYKTTISELTPSQIKDKIDQVKKLLDTYGDASELTISNGDWGIADTITLEEGDIGEFTLNPQFKDPSGNVKTITSDRIKYTSSNTSIATIDDTGKITINSQKANSSFSVIFNVTIDGILVGTKSVTIKFEEKQITAADVLETANFNGVGDGSGGHLEVFGTTVPAENTQVSASNFADLYNNNAVIQLHRERGNYTDDDLAKKRLGCLINMITGALLNSGTEFDRTILLQAATNVQNKYNNLEHTKIKENWEKDKLARYAASEIQNGNCTNNAIVRYEDTYNKNYNVYLVSFRGLVDDILAEYNRLA